MIDSNNASFSTDPYFKLIATSLPYCTYRNKERYINNNFPTQPIHNTSVNARLIDNQVSLYNDLLSSDAFIPSKLLFGTLGIDRINNSSCGSSNKVTNNNNKVNSGVIINHRRTSIATLHHDDESFFVHMSGRYMDEVTLRNSEKCYQNTDMPSPYGYTLPLSKGSALIQVLTAGSSHYGSSSHLLARTQNEVFYMRTVSLDDIKAPQPSKYSQHVTIDHAPVILEPIQKFVLPFNISDMSTTPTSNWSNAKIITKCGKFYLWNPSTGINIKTIGSDHSSSGRSIIPDNIWNNSYNYLGRLNGSSLMNSTPSDYIIENSLHPQVAYITIDRTILTYDERTHTTARYLCNGSTSISSIKQHGMIGHHFMVSYDDMTCLYDSRYTKYAVARKDMPCSHSMMKYCTTPFSDDYAGCNDRSSSGVFIGSSSHHSPIYMHSLGDNQSSSSLSSSSAGHASTNRKNAHDLLGLSSVFRAQNTVHWAVQSFPTIDPIVWGIEIIPSISSPPIDSSDDHHINTSRTDQDDHHDHHRRCSSVKNALLLHQNCYGDVYVQRLRWGDLRSPVDMDSISTKTSSTLHDDNHQLQLQQKQQQQHQQQQQQQQQQHKQRDQEKIKSKKRTHNTMLSSSSDSDSSDDPLLSMDNPPVLHDDQSHKMMMKMMKKKKKNMMMTDANDKYHHNTTIPHVALYNPPIQYSLPCGVRCFNVGNTTTMQHHHNHHHNRRRHQQHKQNLYKILTTNKKVIRHFHLNTGTKYNGLIVRHAVSSFDSSNGIDIYPLPCSTFIPFITEDSLKRFDLLRVFPSEIHKSSSSSSHHHHAAAAAADVDADGDDNNDDNDDMDDDHNNDDDGSGVSNRLRKQRSNNSNSSRSNINNHTKHSSNSSSSSKNSSSSSSSSKCNYLSIEYIHSIVDTIRRKGPQTLWEISRFLSTTWSQSSSSSSSVDIDIIQLRKSMLLSSCSNVREGVVPFFHTTTENICSNFNNIYDNDNNYDKNNADGANGKRTTTSSNEPMETDSDDSDSDSEYVDNDDESSENNNIRNNQNNNIKHTHNTIVPSNEYIDFQQTFDNLYVKDMHTISAIHYYKDNAFGAELRIGRRVPIVEGGRGRGKRGGGGGGRNRGNNRSNNRVDGYRGASSSCVCQRYNSMVDLKTQSDKLKLCSEIDCITSHYLIYYIHDDEKGVLSCYSAKSTETNDNIQESSSTSSSSSSKVNQVKTPYILSEDTMNYLRSHWEV